MRPQPHEYSQSPYTSRYIDLVPETDAVAVLHQQAAARLLQPLAEGQAGHRYAPGKWSIREVLGHITDTERIFAYRALCFARGEVQPLPGFDENQYVAASGFDGRPLADLLAEYAAVRAATVHLFRSFGEAALSATGTASGKALSVRAIVFMLAGHERHHLNILRERYSI